MKHRWKHNRDVWRAIGLILLGLGLFSAGDLRGSNTLQLVSAPAATVTVSAGGSGYSDLPIVSADGRYVVFASTAGNLVTNPNAGPVSGRAPRSLQVFVRDRQAGTTTLVSVNTTGLPGNGDSFPSGISTNGQFVLFESAASDLMSADTNSQTDVFLRDIVNDQTMLISATTNGVSGSGNSHNAVMTPDARFIAFSSTATNLVAGDTNGIGDVFVRDRQAGTTTLASVGAISTGSMFLPSTSESPDITPDGRFVAFYTSATNLFSGATNAGQVFVRDMSMGTTLWASTNALGLFRSVFGNTANEVACNQRLSADGKYVVFGACTNPPATTNVYAQGIILRYNLQTGLTDLISTNATAPAIQFEDINTLDITPDGRYVAFVAVTNIGSSPATCINLWDGQSGATTLISQNRTGGVTAHDDCLWPRMDSTGRYVAFTAAATNLTVNTTAGYNCYLRDTQAGTTTLVNVDTNGNGSGISSLTPPSLCNDGHLIAFTGGDGSLAPNNGSGDTDVFARDENAGTTELISAHDPAQADGSADFTSGFSSVSASFSGLFIAFTSEGSLAANDTNGMRDVYLRDVLKGTNILVSVNTNGVAAGGMSSEPAVDASGRYVIFSSTATDLVAGDTNNSIDVFLRDVVAGTTTLVSRDVTGHGEGNADSTAPQMSADARYVIFYSTANNLAAGSFSPGSRNIFLRDTLLGTNYALTIQGVSVGNMTPDGYRIAFFDTTAKNVYVWDTVAAKRVYTNTLTSSSAAPSISPDGKLVAWFDTQFRVANVASNVVTVVSTAISPGRIGAKFSNDGRFLVYANNMANSFDLNGVSDIYLYDVQAGTNYLISRGFNSSMAANGVADAPVISSDGRYIAYRTFANNSVATDLNEAPDMMLFDRSNAVNTLITMSAAGNRTANNRSTPPVFSADGKNLVFTSWATDLRGNDFNPGSDVFLAALPGSAVLTNSMGGFGSGVITGLQMLPFSTVSNTPAFSWATVPDGSYHIQYKDDLSDPVWHDFSGNVTVMGTNGSGYDANPATDHRFYRVVSGN